MKVLVVVAVVCVPWMLVSKPVYLLILHKNRTKVSLSSLLTFHTLPSLLVPHLPLLLPHLSLSLSLSLPS